MVKQIDVDEIVRAVYGNLLYWNERKPIESVVYFDEQPQRHCLFLVNRLNNENDLIDRMKHYEVSGVIVNSNLEINLKKWMEAELGVIEVENVKTAYLEIAEFYRKKFNIPMIEVIGSSGKTTTKEMIGCVLNQKYNTLVGYVNYNAPAGVAYNILDLEEHHEACVLEAGMKGFGIIDLSSSLIKPNIAVVTSIQRAHYSSLGSIENIIKAKSEIINHLSSEATLIINGDDTDCLNMPLHEFKGRLLTFGLDHSNDLYAKNIQYDQGVTTFDAIFIEHDKHKTYQFAIKTFGNYNVTNALAAILVGYLLNIPSYDIKKGLLKFKPMSGRQEVIKGINHSTIINDNFNANPESTKQLIDELPIIARNKPLVLVLGDIERPNDQYKEYAESVHYDIGKQLSTLNLTYLILIGKWANQIKKAAIEHGVDERIIYYYQRVQDAKVKIKELIEKNSVVVFKAQKAYIDFSDLIELISK